MSLIELGIQVVKKVILEREIKEGTNGSLFEAISALVNEPGDVCVLPKWKRKIPRKDKITCLRVIYI